MPRVFRSDRSVETPFEPLEGRSRRPELLAPATAGQIVGDLLRCDLQAQEGVDAWEVPAQGGRARGIDRALHVSRAFYLKVTFHFEAAERIAVRAAMRHQVGKDTVLADVSLEPRAVDDEVGTDLLVAVGSVDEAHHATT